MTTDAISPPDAIRMLFSVELSEYKGFKDLVYPLIRNKDFLNVYKKHMGGASNKHHLFIARDSLNKFYNAVILQGFFADSKRVRLIFSDKKKRLEAAEFLDIILSKRQSILGVGLQSTKLTEFIQVIKSDISLTEHRLPNPFIELPQLSLNGLTSVMQALLVQSTVLTQGETMMFHYLHGDIEKAYQVACLLEPTDKILVRYHAVICQQYKEAKEFEDLLNYLLD